MKCDKCGKEFQTYRGICPYCHNKNEKDNLEQPNIKYTPIVKPNPPISERSRDPTGNISPQTSKTRKIPDSTLKYALMAGIVLLVVLSVGAMAQAFFGGSPSASAPKIYSAPAPTDAAIPSITQIKSSEIVFATNTPATAGTLSPYSGDPDPIIPNPQAIRYVAPGNPHTVAILSTTRSTSSSASTVVYATPNTATNPTAPIAIISTPTTITTIPTTITTVPTTITYTPTPVPKPPVILSVSPDRDTVKAGETVDFNVIIESERPIDQISIAEWDAYNTVGEPTSGHQTDIQALGNNRWKFSISIPTSADSPAGTVELTKIRRIALMFQRELNGPWEGTVLAEPWLGSLFVHVKRDDGGTVEPVIISITPDKAEISVGEPAYFTVTVRSSLVVGQYGFSYYSYSLPNGGGARVNGGLDYQKTGDDTWQGKLRIQTLEYWPTGDVVLNEIKVNNALQQSDTWTQPVKVHVIGKPNTKVNGT